MATSSTQGVYSYSGVGFVNPHAATTIGTSTITTLAYDPNGNLASTTRSGTVWDYTWNYRNQLTQVATGTATTTFGYGIGVRYLSFPNLYATMHPWDEHHVLM